MDYNLGTRYDGGSVVVVTFTFGRVLSHVRALLCHIHQCANAQRGLEVQRENKLWWKGGQPYNAPHVEKGDYLLQRHWQK